LFFTIIIIIVIVVIIFIIIKGFVLCFFTRILILKTKLYLYSVKVLGK